MAWLQWNRLVVRERPWACLVTTAGLFASALVINQVGYSLVSGLPVIRHLNFWTTSGDTAPLSPLSVGGVVHAGRHPGAAGAGHPVVVPLGILAALFLSEVGGRMARPVRTIVDAMTALPSIVAGLLIYVLAILALGFPRSGFAASLAIAMTMLPIVTRASEVVLRVVPGTLREASFALGSSQWRTVWKVILPTARSGLTTAVVLAMARGIGETAPVLLTAGLTPT